MRAGYYKGACGGPTTHPHSRPRRVHARNYMRGSVYRMPSRMAANCPMGPCVYREIEKYTPILLHTGRVPAWGAKVLLIGSEHPVVPQGASAADGAFEYYSGESAILGPRRP